MIEDTCLLIPDKSMTMLTSHCPSRLHTYGFLIAMDRLKKFLHLNISLIIVNWYRTVLHKTSSVKWGNFEHLSNFEVFLKLCPIFFAQFFLAEKPNQELF